VLRDHLDGGVAPPRVATPDDEHYFTLCMHSEPVGTTTASLVAQLPADRTVPWPIWVSFATPCTGIFVPVYLEGIIPAALARGCESGSEGQDSAWWAMHRLHEAAAIDYARFTPVLRDAWRALEAKIDADRQRVERRARAASIAGDRDEAGRLLTDLMAAIVDEVLVLANELRSRITS
jgi:secernin